ncbi:hypothetical protein Prum_025850 [Phytohabitans rumicis]|uniref:Uncharacterized protein n=1 Tax=Phytohabitans rumicis TaxID=1076125 RepID=A0A6V8KV41_9ACTN|nr:hypothetical protein Prum_025850 [Phytohabitans rumicis]
MPVPVQRAEQGAQQRVPGQLAQVPVLVQPGDQPLLLLGDLLALRLGAAAVLAVRLR